MLCLVIADRVIVSSRCAFDSNLRVVKLRKLLLVYLPYCLAGCRLQSVIDALHVPLLDLSPAQRQVVVALKSQGGASAEDLAEPVGITSSGVRQHPADRRRIMGWLQRLDMDAKFAERFLNEGCSDGKIVASGGMELAQQLEEDGYEAFR